MNNYYLVKNSFYLLNRLLFRIESKGVENVPKDGAYILCPNHTSNFDPPAVIGFIKRQIHFMAKTEMFSTKFSKWFFLSCGAFPVKRDGIDRKALTTALKYLRDGKPICLFPEGTRSKDGNLGDFKSGVSVLAYKTNVPIIPVAIVGEYKLFKKVKVIYGKPIYVHNNNDNVTNDHHTSTMENVMNQIISMKKTAIDII